MRTAEAAHTQVCENYHLNHTHHFLFASSRIREVKHIIMHADHEPRKHCPERHDKSILKEEVS